MDSGIYMLEFPRGESYVGQSVNMPYRFEEHGLSFERSKAASKLQQAYVNNNAVYKFSRLVRCHPDYLNILEACFIHKLNPSLNTILPKEGRYDWEVAERLAYSDTRFEPITQVISRLEELEARTSQQEVRLTELETSNDQLSNIAEEQEISAIQAEQLLKYPDAVKTLQAELSSTRAMYQELQLSFWELHSKINEHNSKQWWKRFTKV